MFRPTGRYLLFLAASTLLLVEIHEQGHAIATRLLCGGWADRVFDNVLTYSGCSASSLAVVDLVGPLFSYAMLWTGALMSRRQSPVTRGLGLSLAFASLPLARVVPQVLVALVAGSTSDEYGFVRRIAGDAIERAGAGGLALLAALALTLPPLLMGWRQLPIGRRGRTRSGLWFLPFVCGILWAATRNSALAHGVLHQALLPGWPTLLAVQAAAVAGVVWLLRDEVRRLVEGDPAPAMTDMSGVPSRP